MGNSPALVAIDAPLVVPNHEGLRPAERVAGALFRGYSAAPYPVNRNLLAQWSDDVRGETLAVMLERQGIEHRPFIRRREQCRVFFEVYTHASMVMLFGLDQRLPYKRGPREERLKGFRHLQECLRKLRYSEVHLSLPDHLLYKDVEKMDSRLLKEYEDVLDAVVCAYTACYAWHHPERCEVLGDVQRGYILTPVHPTMRKQLPSLIQ